MAPLPYLLYVESGPTKVSSDVWKQWYVQEHLHELVQATGVGKRASVFEQAAAVFDPEPARPRPFAALYQTEFENIFNTPNFARAKSTSELFLKAGAESDKFADNGDFDGRMYNLVDEFNPKGTAESASPQLFAVEVEPGNHDDFIKWYREEHIDLLAKIPGYRRTLLYKRGVNTPMTKASETLPYLAIHEFDDVNTGLTSKEAQSASTTEWAKKQASEAKGQKLQAWKLFHSEGF